MDRLARQFKRGFVTKEGYLVWDATYAPFFEVDYCYHGKYDSKEIYRVVSEFRPEPYVRTKGAGNCLDALGIGNLELRVEFNPVLLVGRNRDRIRKFSTSTGVRVVTQLMEYLEAHLDQV